MTAERSAENEEGLWLFGYGSLIWKPPPHYGTLYSPLAPHLDQEMAETVLADKRVPGYIEGYVRRFWQASQDHRGTPEAPGRVATLISREHWETLTDYHATAPPRTWGAAYHIPPARVKEVKEYLDIREINGYTIDMAAFHVPVQLPEASNIKELNLPQSATDEAASKQLAENSAEFDAPTPITCLVYIGLPTNPQFVGPQDPDELARHIVTHRGPSGENKEYVYMLDEALNGLRRDTGVNEDVDEHVTDLARRVRREERLLLYQNEMQQSN